MTDPLARCFSEARLNGLTLRNRLIKASTFEGKTPGGLPSPALKDLHVRLGQGGIAMTTIGYCAAEADGRLNENMLYMDEYVREPLSQLIGAVQATGARVAGQLAHCGNFTRNAEFRGRFPRGPSFGINKLGLTAGLPFGLAMTKAQIRERVGTFARAATFMKSVGFDAIEIHFGHGYGLSQFISPKTNHRTDEYGGSLHNRMRFPLEVLAAVRKAVGDDFPLLGKISMTDGVRGGVSYEDSIEIAALLEAGGIDAIICSAGTSSMNPMLLFHGPSIGGEMIRNEKNPVMKLGMKLVEKQFFREYPYREMYLMEHALRIRNRVQCGVCYVGGVCTSDSIRAVMKEGFDFIQLGRGLLFDPDFAHNASADANYRNGCTHCNKCATLIDSPEGIRCVLR
jgi:2,4-dienoyl-CoA reductase-like NADH-dependent reductase (Old Yellow Enzyme family)